MSRRSAAVRTALVRFIVETILCALRKLLGYDRDAAKYKSLNTETRKCRTELNGMQGEDGSFYDEGELHCQQSFR